MANEHRVRATYCRLLADQPERFTGYLGTYLSAITGVKFIYIHLARPILGR